jgi:carboxyl-terminal processing protease
MLRFMKSRPFRHASMAALVAIAFLAGSLTAKPQLASATSEVESPFTALKQLARVLVQIEAQYVDPVERKRIAEGAIRGMVANLDPHSSYMNREEYTSFQNDSDGVFGGIGIEVDLRGNRVTVLAPIEGGPAERAGIRSGDQILGVGTDTVEEQGIDAVMKLLRGAAGTSVRLVIKRGNDEPFLLTLTREVIHIHAVVARRLEGDVLYLRIKQFITDTHLEVLREVTKASGASKKPFRGIVVDLRSNPGGLVNEAVYIADEFLTSGNILSMRSRGKIVETHDASSGGIFGATPTVVLVNEWTASASEFLAGALQDHKRATIVGLTTFGKGSVQTIFDLPGGEGLKITTARYYTPSGRAVQGKGIEPDVLIQPAKAGADLLPVLKEADLDGALASEGDSKKKNAIRIAVDAGPSELSGGGSPQLPLQQLLSKDVLLKIGFETLQKEMRP